VTTLAGVFLVAHGLVHLAVWVAPAPPDAPFDSRHSWLLGDVEALSRAAAVVACAVLVLAGILVLVGADPGAALAAIGAGLSLLLVLVTFHAWFIAAVAINIGIIVIALA
jgi:hypothetical protein